MQRTYGNRAVQRAHSTHNTTARVAVQRSPYGETYENLEKQLGKDNPALEAHKWMLNMDSPNRNDGGFGGFGIYQAVKPYWDARSNEAGGIEGGFGIYQGMSDEGQEDALYGEGKYGAWDEDGGRQYGQKTGAGVARTRDGSGGMDILTIGGEQSIGENGLRLQGGATGMGGEMTMGDIDKESSDDTQLRVGANYGGPSFGLRLHWGDPDRDRRRNWGFGIDYGFGSVDFTSENPLLQGPVPLLVDALTGDDGPTVGELVQSQVRNAQLAAQKDRIVKENGALGETKYKMMQMGYLPVPEYAK
jgi:hypothetical protein